MVVAETTPIVDYSVADDVDDADVDDDAQQNNLAVAIRSTKWTVDDAMKRKLLQMATVAGDV